MGLLSDPEYGSVKWVKILKKIHWPLCFLCYIGAIVWFVMLGNKEFNNETYFSENALLPGLVTNEFNGENSAKQFYNELMSELEDKYELSEEIPVPWLVAKLSQLHLEVYTHNFTLNYPLGQGQVYKGTNVYGILRAPRTASLEALVISAPFRPENSHQKATTAGIALMLAFAQFARSQKYWAKDIIFLVTEHEQLGMQAWLEAYHGIQSNPETFYTSLGSFWKPGTPSLDINKLFEKYQWSGNNNKPLDPGKLKGRSGSIQAAINLELHAPKIKYIEVKIEGLNGQLPNLDLVNLVHKLCVKSGIHHSYKNSYSWMRTRDRMEEWMNQVWTMLGMVQTQLAGVPSGNHGLFHRFGIEAVTLEGRDADDPGGKAPRAHALTSANFYRLGIALESIMRSLNNLLERFHQSYFFYLLASTNRFISIGQYMPSLCLLCGAMLVQALVLWVEMQKETKDDQNYTKKRKNSDTKLEEKVSPEESKPHQIRERTSDAESMSVVSIGTNYIVVHLVGYMVMNSPIIFSQIGATFDQHTEVSVFYGLVATSILLTVLSPFSLRLLSRTRLTHEELTLVNILLLVELSTICLCVGMHNFPLGLCLGVIYTPLALIVRVVSKEESKRRLVLFLKRILCLLLHPLSVVTIGLIMYSRVLFPEENVLEMVGRGRDAAMQAIMFSVVDSMIYGNWLYNVGTAVILPVWIIFWQILCNKVQD